MKAALFLLSKPTATVTDLRRAFDAAFEKIMIDRGAIAPVEGAVTVDEDTITLGWLISESDRG